MNAINRAMVLGTLVALGAVYSTKADDQTDAPNGLYQANEVSLDLFGTGSINQETINNISRNRIRHDGRAGAGFGINYFPSRYLGFSADTYSEDTQGSFFDSVAGNAILRLPLGPVAPYIFGGGGHQFDQVSQTYGDAGAGIEVRFTHNWGIFVDGRYIFAEETRNYGLGRAGLRLTF